MLGSIAAQDAVLVGTLQLQEANLTGHIAIAVDHEYYTGSYDVTPKVVPQVLKTSDKVMTNDVTVKGIPSYEVTNPQGGSTFIIGGD